MNEVIFFKRLTLWHIMKWDFARYRLSFVGALDFDQISARGHAVRRCAEPRQFGMNQQSEFQDFHSQHCHGFIADHILVIVAMPSKYIPLEHIETFRLDQFRADIASLTVKSRNPHGTRAVRRSDQRLTALVPFGGSLRPLFAFEEFDDLWVHVLRRHDDCFVLL